MAHGGQALGFALAIVDGKPLFGYRSAAGFKDRWGRDSVVGKWAKVTAKLTVDRNCSSMLTADWTQRSQSRS